MTETQLWSWMRQDSTRRATATLARKVLYQVRVGRSRWGGFYRDRYLPKGTTVQIEQALESGMLQIRPVTDVNHRLISIPATENSGVDWADEPTGPQGVIAEIKPL